MQRPFSNFLLRFLTFFCSRKKNRPSIPQNPKKILICNIANFGDLIISTTVLPALKKKFPESKLGFLAASLPGSAILKDHPLISHVHSLDHWYLQRSKGVCKAALLHKQTRKKALQEIRKIGYEIAIDLYSYFPNAIPFLHASKIPVVIGYPTGGFSKLLTHSMPWSFADLYVGHAHLHLLKQLGIDPAKESPLPSYNLKKTTRDHVVVHMGSSSTLKEWDF